MQDSEQNPYLWAQRVWNERWGEYASAAQSWKLMAFFGIGLAFIGITGAVYIGLQSKFVPYVIETDSNGNILSVGIPGQKAPNDIVLKASLRDWVTAHRSVVADAGVQRGYLERVYAFLLDGAPAKATVDGWYTRPGMSPFDRMTEGTVAVEVESILPQSDSSYQIDWIERASEPSGKPIRRFDESGREVHGERFRGIFTVEFHEVDEVTLEQNPLGLFFRNISIQRLGG